MNEENKTPVAERTNRKHRFKHHRDNLKKQANANTQNVLANEVALDIAESEGKKNLNNANIKTVIIP